MPSKGKDPPHTLIQLHCEKQARLPRLRADSQISLQISYLLLSFLEALTTLETCFLSFSFPLLENREGGGLKTFGVIFEIRVNLNLPFSLLVPTSQG